tara:strand:- start:4067 stop:6364 length:2298 start_codon:yes stop_codon:yes gene_type:complete
MKKYASIISFLIVIFAALWGFYDSSPSSVKSPKSSTDFSVEKALSHLKEISKESHHVGTEAHKTVQNYIVSELQKLGLEPTIQTQTIVNKKWFAGTTVENIIVKIDGSETGKSLLLLSHYDSNPHSALGASDAGSGVVTILEGLRAYLAKNQQPKNDIIILISDAEELGLLGAKAFVEYHPLAKNIGLVLNFEARGSGGPSYMLLETNGKNSKMITEFLKANPTYPASNSLLYSIYKKLPNDTDLTVFRENGDINGFNFAFIGDHFDYHTVQDSYERLDRTTLAHQADYLMNLLNYFSDSDIENLQSDVDLIYVNFPFVKLLTYPFSWVMPLYIVAGVLLLILVFFGIASNKIKLNQLLIGFIPSILSLILCGGVSYYLWKLLLIIHPPYKDMLHGFTYNGYWYIIAFVCLNIWLLFLIYKKFTKKDNSTSLLIAPIVIWMIINFLIQEDFKGAGFLIIPVFIAEVILAISIFYKPSNKNFSVLFAVLSIPTIYILAPLVKLFPVGLGLKMLFVSALFLALLFGLLLPVINASKSRKGFSKLAGILTLVFFSIATLNAGFDVNNRKPNSLVYVQNMMDSTSYWGTYNNVLDDYVSQKITKNLITENLASAETKSKYNTRFRHYKKGGNRPLKGSSVTIGLDTVIGTERVLEFTIAPNRKINKYELSVRDSLYFNHLSVNNIPVNEGNSFSIKRGSFLVYHMANADEGLQIRLTISKEAHPTILLNEISYDLLNNPLFKIKPRSKEMMPMPFVSNDAIMLTQQIQF